MVPNTKNRYSTARNPAKPMNTVGDELHLHVKARAPLRIAYIATIKAGTKFADKSQIVRRTFAVCEIDRNVIKTYCNTSRQPTRNAAKWPNVTLMKA